MASAGPSTPSTSRFGASPPGSGGSGSGGRRPPRGPGQGSPPSPSFLRAPPRRGGNGSTPQSAQWSLALERNPDEQNTYVVWHLQNNVWVRTTYQEARMYAGFHYAVLDGHNYHPIGENDWAQPNAPSNVPTGTAFQRQDAETERGIDALLAEEEERYGSPKKGSKASTPKSTPRKKGPGSPDDRPGLGGGNRRDSPGGAGAGAGLTT